MLDVPHYTEPADDAAGGDPLGTAPVNEMLYRSAFPGINNVVCYIRIYSAICWMVRQIDSTAEKQRNPDIEQLSNIGLEKIQLLLTWYNVMHRVPGLAGATRKFPPNNRRVVLRFSNIVGPADANIAVINPAHVPGTGAYYLQAVQYGPSLINGLRFLAATSVPNAYQLTTAGELLADAYEAAIAEHPWRNWLADLKKNSVTRSEVYDEMGGLLELSRPSKGEIKAFTDQFYPEGEVLAIGPNWRNRHAGITLTLRALEAEQSLAAEAGKGGVSVEELRYVMASGCARDGSALYLEGIEGVQGWWANLQLRQYQRAALDTLFRCAENWISDAVVYNRPREISDCGAGLGAALTRALPDHHRTRVRSLIDEMQTWRGTHASFYKAGPFLPEQMRLSHLRRALAESSGFEPNTDAEATAIRDAYIALVYCGVEAGNIKSDSNVCQHFDGEHFSMRKLRVQVESHADASPAQFLAHIVHFHVLLQHFSVVQSRSADGRNRFRMFRGENGLERASQKVELSGVSILEDRLRTAVLLLVQCKLVKHLGDGRYSLTKQGRRRIGG